MAKIQGHKWEFKARFRRGAFGWRSQPAIQRIKQALSEIKRVARGDPVLGAEGAVTFLERVSSALEHVDGSSGAIGTAVNRAIEELVPVIVRAPANSTTRQGWLERLHEAHAEDDIPYIEELAEYWGQLCASPGLASDWADRMLDVTRRVVGPGHRPGEYYHGSIACLSSLFHAARYAELVELAEGDSCWGHQRWVVKALVALGRKADAIRYAESCRGPYSGDLGIDQLCEEVLLSSGLVEEAYRRYGLRANGAGTYLATFRAVAKKYPLMKPAQILADLIATTPGSEGKWFAAAKEAGLYEEAIALARRSPVDPMTLSRAARDHAAERPRFALEAGLLALRWLLQGYGYEVSGIDVWTAYTRTMEAAELLGATEEARGRVRELSTDAGAGPVVTVVRQALEGQ